MPEEKPTLKDLVAQIGSELGLPNFQVGKENAIALELDNRYIVNIEIDEEERKLYFICPVGRLSAIDNRPALYQTLLTANRFYVDTYGASLGIDPDSDEVVLSRMIHAVSLLPSQLTAAFKIFLDAADVWVERFMTGFNEPTEENAEEQQSTTFNKP